MRTYTFPTVQNVKAAIIVQGPCKRIILREDPSAYVNGAATNGYSIYAPTQGDGPTTYQAGEFIEIWVEARFVVGQTIGFLLTPNGSTTIAQMEQ